MGYAEDYRDEVFRRAGIAHRIPNILDIDKVSEQVQPEYSPGFLERFIDLLSTPMYAIQNFARGRWREGLSNIGDLGVNLVTLGAPTLFGTDIAGLGMTTPDERSSFRDVLRKWGVTLPRNFLGTAVGFAGDVATDPLTYLSFGTSATTKLGAKAGLKGGSELFERGLKYGLTDLGQSALKNETENIFKELVARQATSGVRKFSDDILKQVAERKASKKMLSLLPDDLSQLTKDQMKLFDLGGIKYGVPFGKKLNLVPGYKVGSAMQYTGIPAVAGKVRDYVSSTPLGYGLYQIKRKLGKRFGTLPEGVREVLLRQEALGQDEARKLAEKLNVIFEPLSGKQFTEIGHVIEGTAKASSPVVEDAALKIKELLGEIGKTEQDFGLIEGLRENYFPHLYQNEKLAEELLATHKVPLTTANPFAKQRYINTLEEAKQLGLKPIEDAREALAKRIGVHARNVQNYKIKQELAHRFGEDIVKPLKDDLAQWGAEGYSLTAKGEGELKKLVNQELALIEQEIKANRPKPVIPTRGQVEGATKRELINAIATSEKYNVEQKSLLMQHAFSRKELEDMFRAEKRNISKQVKEMASVELDAERALLENPVWKAMRENGVNVARRADDVRDKIPYKDFPPELKKQIEYYFEGGRKKYYDAKNKVWKYRTYKPAVKYDKRIKHNPKARGLDQYYDEWKQMGGAAYGAPKYGETFEAGVEKTDFFDWIGEQLAREKNKTALRREVLENARYSVFDELGETYQGYFDALRKAAGIPEEVIKKPKLTKNQVYDAIRATKRFAPYEIDRIKAFGKNMTAENLTSYLTKAEKKALLDEIEKASGYTKPVQKAVKKLAKKDLPDGGALIDEIRLKVQGDMGVPLKKASPFAKAASKMARENSAEQLNELLQRLVDNGAGDTGLAKKLQWAIDIKEGRKQPVKPKIKITDMPGVAEDAKRAAVKRLFEKYGMVTGKGEISQSKLIPEAASEVFVKNKGPKAAFEPKITAVLQDLAKVGGGVPGLHGITSRIIKPMLTTWYPSFHTRNFISGIVMGLVDPNTGLKVLNPKSWKRAVQGLWKGSDELIDVGSGIKKTVSELKEEATKAGVFGKHQIEQETKALGLVNVPKSVQKVTSKLPISREFASNMENLMRFTAYISNREAGLTAMEAAQNVGKWFIDYSASSNVEIIMRDLIPFYKFSREAIPTFGKELLKRPGMAVPLRQIYGTSDEKPSDMPDWLQEAVSLPLGVSKDGKPILGYGYSYLPFDVLQTLGTGKGFGRTFEKNVIGSTNPIIKWLYEIPSGRNTFTGQKAEGFVRAPWWAVQAGMATPVANKDGSTRYVWASKTAQIVNLTPISRLMSTFDKILDPNTDWAKKTIKLVTGLSSVEIDVDAEKERKVKAAIWNAINDSVDPEVRSGLFRLLRGITTRKTPLPTNKGGMTREQLIEILSQKGVK